MNILHFLPTQFTPITNYNVDRSLLLLLNITQFDWVKLLLVYLQTVYTFHTWLLIKSERAWMWQLLKWPSNWTLDESMLCFINESIGMKGKKFQFSYFHKVFQFTVNRLFFDSQLRRKQKKFTNKTFYSNQQVIFWREMPKYTLHTATPGKIIIRLTKKQHFSVSLEHANYN